GVFNFAQGIMMVFSALSLVSIYALLTTAFGLPSLVAVILSGLATIALMFLLALSVERFVLRPLINQPDIILFMATIGLNSFLIGFGETIFGGEPKTMITSELGLPTGSTAVDMLGGRVIFQHLDIAAAVVAGLMVAALAIFFNVSKIGRALRAVADDHQAAQSVGITLQQIWVIVWFAAGIVAIVAGIMWGARSDVSFALEILALKALPVLILGGFTSIPGAIIGGLIIGISEKLFEFYWGTPMLGGSTESWFPFFLALIFLLFRPQGLFGDKIIERI
ncbi:MAG: branched-chain amino acid ABC transporter permease, partial [Pseudomonadota bacterium]